jgi:prolipoprotein diacylglyceryltransferase
LYAHGILLVTGTVTGSVIFLNRARVFSLSRKMALGFVFLFVPIGFLGCHLMYCAFEDPNSLFKLQGINSFGGILTCLSGFALFICGQGEYGWRWFDAASYGAVCAALMARIGCFLAHDRLGIHTPFWLSVKCFDGPRYDLALFEVIFLGTWLAALFAMEWPGLHPRSGTIFGTLALSYGLLRLMLSQLDELARRYYGLTAEQLGGAVLVAVGTGCLSLIYKSPRQLH